MTGDNGGATKSPSETVIHWISDRPTLEVICEERTPPKTNVVTCVGFRHSLYESYNADMPLFGSGSGGAASVTGASARSEDETSRGARLKENADEGTMSGASPVMLTIRLGSRPPREVRLTIPANETNTPYYLVYS